MVKHRISLDVHAMKVVENDTDMEISEDVIICSLFNSTTASDRGDSWA